MPQRHSIPPAHGQPPPFSTWAQPGPPKMDMKGTHVIREDSVLEKPASCVFRRYVVLIGSHLNNDDENSRGVTEKPWGL